MTNAIVAIDRLGRRLAEEREIRRDPELRQLHRTAHRDMTREQRTQNRQQLMRGLKGVGVGGAVGAPVGALGGLGLLLALHRHARFVPPDALVRNLKPSALIGAGALSVGMLGALIGGVGSDLKHLPANIRGTLARNRRFVQSHQENLAEARRRIDARKD